MSSSIIRENNKLDGKARKLVVDGKLSCEICCYKLLKEH